MSIASGVWALLIVGSLYLWVGKDPFHQAMGRTAFVGLVTVWVVVTLQTTQ